ncbi:glycerate kinase type-2 family protein [Calditrichota bacterium GD2]
MENFNKVAEQMISAALQAVDPFNLIIEQCRLKDNELVIGRVKRDLTQYRHIYVLGAGKASAAMAQALEKLLGERISGGLVIVKCGHARPTQKIKILEAGHPLPDENTLEATNQLLQLARVAQKDDLVIFLLSGGGSALLEQLPDGITLKDLQELNQLLLGCGANIEEINAVRKHVSLVKGGQLAKQIFPAELVSLILSDVIGDPLAGIASGPTAPDDSTFEGAWNVVLKYGLSKKLPHSIRQRLEKGKGGQIPETPKANDSVFKKVSNIILGNNLLALKKAQETAQQSGFNALILTDRAQGEVAEISKLLAAIFERNFSEQELTRSPGCILLGGEPTVTLRGNGLGGRNQEMALQMLLHLQKVERPFYFCSVGTDGTDGPTDAAGAWIDHRSFQKARSKKLDIEAYLQKNDSYHFFAKLDQLIKTGPTGTNVMDIMILLF